MCWSICLKLYKFFFGRLTIRFPYWLTLGANFWYFPAVIDLSKHLVSSGCLIRKSSHWRPQKNSVSKSGLRKCCTFPTNFAGWRSIATNMWAWRSLSCSRQVCNIVVQGSGFWVWYTISKSHFNRTERNRISLILVSCTRFLVFPFLKTWLFSFFNDYCKDHSNWKKGLWI